MKQTTEWAETLAFLLTKHGENPTSLAEKSGVSQPTIQRILTGTTASPEAATLKKLAEAVGEDLGIFGVGVSGYRLTVELQKASDLEREAYREARAAVREGRIAPENLLALVRAATARRNPPTS